MESHHPSDIQIAEGTLSAPIVFTGIEDTLAISSLEDGNYTITVTDFHSVRMIWGK